MISQVCTLNLSDEELSRWHDDDLDAARMALIRTHIATCPSCRERLDAFEEIGAGLRALQPPPLDLVRLMAGVQAAAEVSHQAPARLISPAPRMVHRSHRWLAGASGLAAVLILSLLAGYLFMTHGRVPSERQTQSTPQATVVPGSQSELTAVGMSSATDGWAMGRTYTDGNVSDDPAEVLHYTNGRWVPVKTAIAGEIAVIKMFSATDGWAIGDRIYHYDGVTWRQVTIPGSYGGFITLSAVSSTNIWIASDGSVDNHALILHYDGQTWTRQSTPALGDYFSVYGLSMVSATDGWAVGDATLDGNKGYYPPTGAILHYSNGAWHLAKKLPGYDLRAIGMGTASDGWAGGSLVSLSQTGPMPAGQSPFQSNTPALWHYTGGAWIQTPVRAVTPATNSLGEGQIQSFTMFSATNGWMIAGLDARQALESEPHLGDTLYHLEQGRWVATATKVVPDRRFSDILQVAFVSPDDFWAVGQSIWWTGIPSNSTPGTSVPTTSAESGGGYTPTVTPLIAHYHNGAWDIIES